MSKKRQLCTVTLADLQPRSIISKLSTDKWGVKFHLKILGTHTSRCEVTKNTNRINGGPEPRPAVHQMERTTCKLLKTKGDNRMHAMAWG